MLKILFVFLFSLPAYSYEAKCYYEIQRVTGERVKSFQGKSKDTYVACLKAKDLCEEDLKNRTSQLPKMICKEVPPKGLKVVRKTCYIYLLDQYDRSIKSFYAIKKGSRDELVESQAYACNRAMKYCNEFQEEFDFKDYPCRLPAKY